jgi:hypothetical protein
MNKFPEDDEQLVKFLRQHTGTVPPAAQDLEEQIITTISSAPQRSSRQQLKWIFPTAIAAGLLLAWTSYRVLMPTSPSPAEVASLEAFLESNWDGVLNSDAEADSFPLTSPTIN